MTRVALMAAAALLIHTGAAGAAAWTVDPAKSTLGFTGSQTGTPFTGRFKTWTAAIDFDPAHLEACHVSAKVDMAIATTDDPQKEEALPTPDWFDAASFSTASFDSAGFVPKGGDSYGPKSPAVCKPDTNDLLRRMKKVDPNQSKRYRQRTGQ